MGELTTSPQVLKTKKTSTTFDDLNDVTLGSSAILENQHSNEAEEKIENLGQK